jgi:hypothetical protein
VGWRDGAESWTGVMLYSVDLGRTYSPETVAAMTAAFDTVCQSLSTRMNGNDEARRILALAILRHVDQGERDPAHLVEVGLRELAGTDLAATG